MCCEYRSWEFPFCLQYDASGTAVGATLRQKDASGIANPLAFVSHKLTMTQCRRSTIEREAYANPLQYIRESATKSAKLLQWSLALTEFDLDINYTKNSENAVADCLSRM